MPPLADRENFEASIIAGLAPIFADQYARAAAAAASSLGAVPYAQFQMDLQAAMQSELAEVFAAAGSAIAVGYAVILSQGAFEQSGRQWAFGMARELAAQVIETSRRMTADAWELAKGDRQRLAEALALIYLAPSRLESIAITETTRAISSGERSAVLLFPQDASQSIGGVSGAGQPEAVESVSTMMPAVAALALMPGGVLSDAISPLSPLPGDRLSTTEGRAQFPPTVPRSRLGLLVPVWRIEDESACEKICQPLNGHGELVYGRDFPGGPPAHPRCRCFLVWQYAVDVGRDAA